MKLPNQIDVPTFDGLHLGPTTQLRPDVEGRCGCFYYWAESIAAQLGGMNSGFFQRADTVLDRHVRKAGAGVDYEGITGVSAPDTLKRRRIAYAALREAWQSYGYE